MKDGGSDEANEDDKGNHEDSDDSAHDDENDYHVKMVLMRIMIKMGMMLMTTNKVNDLSYCKSITFQVQTSPVPTRYFFVEFFKKTAAGTYVFPEVADMSEITPGEPCHYEWRVMPAPKLLARPGSSRTDSLGC
ncbi:hypothetical protein PoB_005225500 [Plakobranchus ocellatus]|uniref:Uncharacterized protein n=1 Tax=Plakobranchus ocellatus TaxID=259542 RepID=A0AAV4BZB9_9GAST|nr:hypothetical protein PoB_005225500 [Plakobranchus ocellatus]